MKILLMFACIVASTILWSQPAGDNAHIPKIIPPSPNAAAIEKFGDIPVGYATGIPSISYPFWSWQRGKLNLSLGLSYHAGGHKVDDMASNTGLGWTLSGTCRISRTVRGVHDDHNVRGFMYTDPFPFLVTDEYDEDYHNHPSGGGATYVDPALVITAYNSTYSTMIKNINEGWLDAEQDIFSYSINGKSGRFVISKQKEIVPLEYTAVKFEMDNTGPNGSIKSFTITDDNGVVYLFDITETQDSDNITTSLSLPSANADQNYYSGWLLRKCTDPGTGDEIVYNYGNTNAGTVKYDAGWSESQVFDIDKIQNNGPGVVSSVVPAFDVSSQTYNYSRITLTEQNITSIELPDGSLVEFTYAFDRDDLDNNRALTAVTVKNMYAVTAKKYRLNYGYFISGTSPNISGPTGNDISKRLKLTSIDEMSTDGLDYKRTSYEYNSTELPIRGSNSQDHWGYPNAANNYGLGRIPRIKFEQKEMDIQNSLISGSYGPYLSGADRESDDVLAKAAVLEKIIYPTGGFTRFNYECNRAFDTDNYYIDKKNTDTARWLPVDFNSRVFLSFNGRSSTGVTVYIKITEDNPRGSVPSGCFAEMQDINTIKFRLRSYDDAGFDEIIELPYNSFLTGNYINVTVPLTVSNFWIECIYDVNETCAFMWPFTVKAAVEYTIPKKDKLVGGLRVTSIINNDNLGNEYVKNYSYNGDDGHSSAMLSIIPDLQLFQVDKILL